MAGLIAPAAAAGKRLALVIGNSNYESIDPVRNAAGDSQAVARVLGDLGFEVTLVNNAGVAEMKSAVDKLARDAEGAEATLVYYSGHGFQMGGSNFLVPTDARLDSREAAARETLQLDTIVSKLSHRDRQTLILLDACRDNPLPASVRGSDAAQGLAQIQTGINTYVAFATAPGRVSFDGNGENGPFASALVRFMPLPDTGITEVMNSVRRSVVDQTNSLQMPWDQSSLLDPFYFNRGIESEGGIEIVSVEGVELGPVISPVPPPGKTPAGQPPAAGEPQFRVADLPASLPKLGDVKSTGVAPTIGAEPAAPAAPAATGVEPARPVGPVTEQVADIPPALAPISPGPAVVGVEIEPEAVPGVEVEAVDPQRVAELVQEELKRIGCYTGGIDGDWGRGSRGALERYFDSKKVAATSTEPTMELLAALTEEEGRICEPPPQRPRQTTTQVAQPARPPAAKPPAAKPPEAAAPAKPAAGGLGACTGCFR